MSVRFVKGHGTENDFVLVPDPHDELDLTPEAVRAICDRRAGIGGDGLIRVATAPSGGWFMDYRNSDGSLAEMCGNGVRVFARYLVDSGLEASREFVVHTRAGERAVTVTDDAVTVEMGRVALGARSTATVGDRTLAGTAVDVGNPHLVCAVDDVDDLDLSTAPGFDAAAFPHGVNVEFVTRAAPDSVRFRVFERGSGETRSCGTGIVAAAAAVLAGDTGTLTVDTPGGRTSATITATGSTLCGPAVLVASGEIDSRWLARHLPARV
ncbi:MAG: diaminopimelate epimerase [Actinomycetota bacterium]|nr:diaminopimelate epimerase [Actinomycetota bacterium]